MRRLALALALALAFAVVPVASAATTATEPIYDSKGRLVQAPYAPPDLSRLSKKKASDIFLHVPKVVDWLKRYPKVVTYDASFDSKSRQWTVHVWSGRAGEVAQGKVDDATGDVLQAYTGPQVAWG